MMIYNPHIYSSAVASEHFPYSTHDDGYRSARPGGSMKTCWGQRSDHSQAWPTGPATSLAVGVQLISVIEEWCLVYCSLNMFTEI